MKIGIIVSFFDFRADVRDLIRAYQSSGHDLVLFFRKEEEKDIARHPLDGVEYRVIREENRTLLNRFYEYIFLIFKRLPVSRKNYFLMELFKISNNPVKKSRFIGSLILKLQYLGFNFISYDFLLANLRYSGQTPIQDIDQFIGFTEFHSDYLAARLLNENRPLNIYVYSWDHPCKHTRFSKKFRYKVWSEGIREDMLSLQKVPEKNITVAGSTQFSYLFQFLSLENGTQSPIGFPYVYYCCAIGIQHLIPGEIAIIEQLAAELKKCRPDWKLLVRPYPVLNNWSVYEPLRVIDNVIVDDGFRISPFPDFTTASFDKFRKLQSAELVFHGGSTIGLEACFLNVPSILVDFGYGSKTSGLSIYGFIHQFQNEKYLLDAGLGMKSPSDLSSFIGNRDAIRLKGAKVAEGFTLLPMSVLAERLLD